MKKIFEYIFFALVSVCLIMLYACTGADRISSVEEKNLTTAGSTAGSQSDSQGTTDSGSGSPTGLDQEEARFLELLNDYRTQNGLSTLEVSAALTRASTWMSEDMATRNYFSHTDSQGRDPFARMAAFEYRYATSMAENIAAGNSNADATFEQWRNSPGHNANMLGGEYQVIGIGRFSSSNSSYGWYWTTDFGGYVDKLLAMFRDLGKWFEGRCLLG